MNAHIPGTETIIIREGADSFLVYATARRNDGTDDHAHRLDLHESEHENLDEAVKEARALADKYRVRYSDIFCEDDDGEWDASFDARVERFLRR